MTILDIKEADKTVILEALRMIVEAPNIRQDDDLEITTGFNWNQYQSVFKNWEKVDESHGGIAATIHGALLYFSEPDNMADRDLWEKFISVSEAEIKNVFDRWRMAWLKQALILLTSDEKELIGNCLRLACSERVVLDENFTKIFWFDRKDAERIAAKWPIIEGYDDYLRNFIPTSMALLAEDNLRSVRNIDEDEFLKEIQSTKETVIKLYLHWSSKILRTTSDSF